MTLCVWTYEPYFPFGFEFMCSKPRNNNECITVTDIRNCPDGVRSVCNCNTFVSQLVISRNIYSIQYSIQRRSVIFVVGVFFVRSIKKSIVHSIIESIIAYKSFFVSYKIPFVIIFYFFGS